MLKEGMKEALRERVLQQMQGAMQLSVAYVGIATGLLDALATLSEASAERLAAHTGNDLGYVARWADAAFAFELVERDGDGFRLAELGRAFASGPGTLMPFAVQTVLGAHMAERAASLTRSGERPGESVLAERASILPLFGPMLEHTFGPVFESVVLGAVPAFARIDAEGGLVVDLGCGNGWYLRRLAQRYPRLRGVGLDAFEQNVESAREEAARAGLGERLTFRSGDLRHFTVEEPVSMIAMNRALHHVWTERSAVFELLQRHLVPGGAAVIWEPAWPAAPATLRSHPRFRGMAFQNLSEHVQGNHFLRPEEIASGFEEVGMTATIYRLLGDTEAVVVGEKSSEG